MDRHFCPYCMSPVEPGEPCPVCGLTEGSYTPSHHHLPPGTVLRDRYLVGRALGEGGFGITYIGCDLRLELKVAIKEYFPTDRASRMSSVSLDVSSYAGAAGSRYENGKERFLQEARTMARMEKLSTIVSVRDFFEVNNTAYIVMEYVDGTTFKELVEQRGGRISAGELLHTIEPLFSALSSMHALGLIHRDISPENLMLEKGEVRLLDFGCARETAGGDATLTIALKHGYAPVEQYQSKGQGPWTDVYALSCTIYYCLTGRKPPQAMDRLVEDELIPPRKLGAELTERQEQALLRGMAPTPRRRFQSVQELHTALYEGVVYAREPEPEPVPPPVPPAPEPEREPDTAPEPEPAPEAVPALRSRWSRRQMGIFAGCAAALLCAIILFAWHPWVRPEDPGNPGGTSQGPGGQAAVSVFRDAAALTGGGEADLRALLADETVSAVTLSGCNIVVTQPLEIGKPLRVEAGSRLDAAQYVTVEAGGSLRAEGELYVNGLLRTRGGGTVSVAPQGTLSGINLLWTEQESDLSVEEGGTVLLHSSQPEDNNHRLVLPEEEVFSRAVHVNSAKQFMAALDENSRPVVIDSDITLEIGDGFGQICAVLVPEGVTVTLSEGTAWCVNGGKLVNRGTIRGGNVQEGQWDVQSPSWIVNYGLIDAGGYFDGAGGLINLGEIRLHQGQFKDSINICNLGTLASCGVKDSPVPVHCDPNGDFFLDIACESLFNYGTLLAEGDGPGETEGSHIYLAGGLRAYNAGEILAGAYGGLDNDTHLENNGGVLRVTEDTGRLENGGVMEFPGTPGSLVVSQDSDSRNNGLILAGREDVDALPERLVREDRGRCIPFAWDALENVRAVTNGPQLRKAMADESCGVVLVERGAEIILESELTVTKTLALEEKGSLGLSSGDLTVAGPEGFLLGNDVDLRGGALRVEDGGAVMARSLANCAGLYLSGERSLLAIDCPPDPGAPVEVDGGTLLSTRDLEFSGSSIRIDGSTARFTGGLSLRGCRVEVGSAGWLYARSCPILLDGGTTLENQGEIELYGWEWQPVELAGTVTNRGRLSLPGHTALSGTLTNREYLSIQDSGSAPLRLSGTLDNRGVIVTSERWDAGIQLADGGSAPGVPEDLIVK